MSRLDRTAINGATYRNTSAVDVRLEAVGDAAPTQENYMAVTVIIRFPDTQGFPRSFECAPEVGEEICYHVEGSDEFTTTCGSSLQAAPARRK
jgi:hypothetical protein